MEKKKPTHEVNGVKQLSVFTPLSPAGKHSISGNRPEFILNQQTYFWSLPSNLSSIKLTVT
jgi:hypothetical protein